MKKFKVFGKKGCDLCKKRLDFVNNYKAKFNALYEIDYLDVDEPAGLVQFAKVSGCSEIPSVVLYEDDTIVKYWSGATDFPNTREMNAYFGTVPIEPDCGVIMKAAHEIKRYPKSEETAKDISEVIEDNRIENQDG